MSDLELDRNYQRNDQGAKVKLIQEWLSLHGMNLALDGDFGPATAVAVKQFQTDSRLSPDGVVGPLTFAKLIEPMTDALKPIAAANESPGQMVVLYAQQHLQSAPRDGFEGDAAKWCAGFSCFVMNQAFTTLNLPLPLQPTFSCDELATRAQQRGMFLAGGPGVDHTRLTAGSFFLNRRAASDWVHTGIITQVQAEAIQTIEGNTNDQGSSEGYEVCQRVRRYGARDFILIA